MSRYLYGRGQPPLRRQYGSPTIRQCRRHASGVFDHDCMLQRVHAVWSVDGRQKVRVDADNCQVTTKVSSPVSSSPLSSSESTTTRIPSSSEPSTRCLTLADALVPYWSSSLADIWEGKSQSSGAQSSSLLVPLSRPPHPILEHYARGESLPELESVLIQPPFVSITKTTTVESELTKYSAIWQAETAPPKSRGHHMALELVLTATGLFLAQWVNPPSIRSHSDINDARPTSALERITDQLHSSSPSFCRRSSQSSQF